MENNWTPGPWSADKHLVAAGSQRIAVAVASPSNDSYYDNARLMAAAPDLYDALAGLVAHLGPGGYIPGAGEPATRRALAALAKARGETP